MMSDATTAFLAFGLLFGGLAAYLAWLSAVARRLEARLAALESHAGATPPTAKGKKGRRGGGHRE